jgi:tRNA threonylcarbamoyladenosine biosynthesis protein TsaB
MSGALVLAVDAATYSGSVALLRGPRVIEEAEVVMRGATEERLMPAIVEVLARAGVGVAELRGVACGAGPGSFTSLRIAAALAKGIAASRRIPLFAASSLTLIVAAEASLGPGDYLAQLDAMRGDLYVQHLRKHADGRIEEAAAPRLLSLSAASELSAASRSITIGNAGAVLGGAPHARGFAVLLGSIAGEVPLASWEPSYGRLAEAQVQWERRHGKALSQP